tara:strand:- start:527 stop:724 length:198 start_codon:yes stop_codon:yes gene_type:complete
MKKNTRILLVIIFGILFLYLFNNYSDYNLKRTIQACILAQKNTSSSFNLEETKKFCENEIRKKID